MIPSTTTLKQVLRPFISPEQYDFWAREVGSVSAWERCFAKVVARSDESADSFTLRLRPNSNMPAYESGQHINLYAVIDGRRVGRSYSLTSLPGERELSITLRREPQGLMSNWLYERATPGAILEIGTVFGDMTLAKSAVSGSDDLLFVAAGSGITPLYGLIRSALQSNHQGKIQLLYWGKTREHFCFDRELAELEKHPRFSVQRITTREPANASSGRICESQVLTLCEEILAGAPHIFMCGGAGFVGAARAIFDGLGQRNLHAESFTAPAPLEPSDDSNEVIYRVELTRSRRTLDVSGKTHLLTALENAGVAVESGCRMGICNTCSCPTTAGRTLDTTTGLVNSGSSTRLCISQPRSHLILDL